MLPQIDIDAVSQDLVNLTHMEFMTSAHIPKAILQNLEIEIEHDKINRALELIVTTAIPREEDALKVHTWSTPRTAWDHVKYDLRRIYQYKPWYHPLRVLQVIINRWAQPVQYAEVHVDIVRLYPELPLPRIPGQTSVLYVHECKCQFPWTKDTGAEADDADTARGKDTDR